MSLRLKSGTAEQMKDRNLKPKKFEGLPFHYLQRKTAT